ncbi:8419_t:CDS:2 [Ambispora gerdemannii]|uniref:8419_t:CDS:1 n=1 Tax=Ambispora gerdemannii TaxID=144530 RepID=A0A9N9B7B7_9GLOM|nr:8419_t:CDS:2 [Ambispora gerdemannii]
MEKRTIILIPLFITISVILLNSASFSIPIHDPCDNPSRECNAPRPFPGIKTEEPKPQPEPNSGEYWIVDTDWLNPWRGDVGIGQPKGTPVLI